MGQLDSVLGSVLAGQNQQSGGLGGLGNVLGGMLGGQQAQQQGPGGLNMGMVAALAPILMSMLANNSQQGGLGGLLDQFTRAGAGNAAQSWVGSGANQSVSPDQVTQALGPDVIGQIASQLGVGHGDAAGGTQHHAFEHHAHLAVVDLAENLAHFRAALVVLDHHLHISSFCFSII